jgi:hypothetical protein
MEGLVNSRIFYLKELALSFFHEAAEGDLGQVPNGQVLVPGEEEHDKMLILTKNSKNSDNFPLIAAFPIKICAKMAKLCDILLNKTHFRPKMGPKIAENS